MLTRNVKEELFLYIRFHIYSIVSNYVIPRTVNLEEDYYYNCDLDDNGFMVLWNITLNEYFLMKEFQLDIEDAREEIYNRLLLEFERGFNLYIGSTKYKLQFDNLNIELMRMWNNDYSAACSISFSII